MVDVADGRFTWDTLRSNKKSRITMGATTLYYFHGEVENLLGETRPEPLPRAPIAC